MAKFQNNGFAERLKTAADAKKALLDKFRPKPAIADPLHSERAAMKAAEIGRVRKERNLVRIAAKQAAAPTASAVDTAALEAKRGQRKALTLVEAKAKRDARYAARKAR